MIILTTENVLTQTFPLITRGGTLTDIVLKDEQTNVEILLSYITTQGSYYTIIQAIFNLVENHFYTLTCFNDSEIIYRDKVFCTDQSIVTFSVNNGQYTSNTTTNEFIVYE
jgi:hypothetical protein